MLRLFLPLIFGGLLLISSAYSASSQGMELLPYGIRFPDNSVQITAALVSLPANMAWVAHFGGQFSSPVEAMTQLRSWCHPDLSPAPAYSKCTLLIAPGVYELGSNQLVMQAGVNIVGMGVNTTVINGTVNFSGQGAGSALIRGAERTALRGLTVRNTGAHVAAVGIYNEENSFVMERVKVVLSGDAGYSIGILNLGSDSTFSDITVSVDSATSANCVGIDNSGTGSIEIRRSKIVVAGCADSVAINNVSAVNLKLVEVEVNAIATGGQAAHGVWNSGSGLMILNSKLKGSTHSLGIGSTSARIINTQLDGSVGADSAGIQCWGTYDSDLTNHPC